jgi:D-glycero-D-manno-heptose 1,7-bisphosphate phosphatase
MKKAVFLDRDGVVNEVVMREGKPFPPSSAEEMRISEGTLEALRRLKERGFLLVVVTNQPDVARGRQTRETVEAMHQRLRSELPLDDILTCYHDDADDCECRKPRPGLLIKAAEKHGIDLRHSYMIGDRWRDSDAGANAGCKTVLIERGYRERAPQFPPDIRVWSLPEAVDWILKTSTECT